LTNYLGNPTVDTTTFASAESICQERSYVCAGGYTTEKTTQQLIAEFLRSFDLKLYVKGDGSLALNILSPTTVFNIDAPTFKQHHDILAWELKFFTDYEAGEQDQVINTVEFDFDFHLARATYQGSGSFNDATSVTDYGEQLVSLQMPWTNAEGTADDAAQRIVNRFKSENAVAVFRTSLKGLRLELGEAIKLSHIEYPSRDGEGITNRFFQVSEINADLDNFTVDIVAPDVNDVLVGGFILGDDTEIVSTWAAAKGTEDEAWGYLCDRASGDFSTGDDGKQYL